MPDLGIPNLTTDPSLDPSQFVPPGGAPASQSPAKPKGKGAETALNLLGTLAGIAGKLFFGPDFNADLGAPFKAGASFLQQKRDEQGMIDLLGGNPHTAPLVSAGQALHESGGLLNNPHILDHPDLLNTFKVGQTDPAPSLDTPGPMQLQANALPPSGLNVHPMVEPTSIAPTAQFPTAEPTAAEVAQGQPTDVSAGGLVNPALSVPSKPAQTDFLSDDFIKRAAVLRPDLVPGLMQARVSRSLDPTQEIMQRLGIAQKIQQMNTYETPEQKREADKKARLDLIQEQGRITAQNREASQANSLSLQKSKINQKEEDTLKAMDEIDQINQEIGANLTPDFVPSQTLGLLEEYGGKGGHLLTQAITPKQALIAKNLRKRESIQVKAFSGAAASDKERAFIGTSLPKLSDDPKLFPLIYRNDVRQSKENRLRYLQQIKARGGDISGYVDPNLVDIYSEMRKKLYQDPQRVQSMYQDEEVKRGLKYLRDNGYDIQYEFAPQKPKK